MGLGEDNSGKKSEAEKSVDTVPLSSDICIHRFGPFNF